MQPTLAEFCNWGKSGREDHPINCVDWSQARAYCEWVGKRLPTEAERVKAARGTERWKYPWGNAAFGEAGRVANIADESLKERFPDWEIAAGYEDGYVGTAPVGSFPAGASPYGALDMVGNVDEWAANDFGDWRGRDGGSWLSTLGDARASVLHRDGADSRNSSVGFRCAQAAEEQSRHDQEPKQQRAAVETESQAKLGSCPHSERSSKGGPYV